MNTFSFTPVDTLGVVFILFSGIYSLLIVQGAHQIVGIVCISLAVIQVTMTTVIEEFCTDM